MMLLFHNFLIHNHYFIIFKLIGQFKIYMVFYLLDQILTLKFMVYL